MNGVMLVFVAIFYVLIIIPCVGVSWIGCRLFDRLGRHPSKTPAIQMSVLFPLVIIEVVSFALLLAFFKALVAEE